MTRSASLLFSTFWSPGQAAQAKPTTRQLRWLVFLLLGYYMILLILTVSHSTEVALTLRPDSITSSEVVADRIWNSGIIVSGGILVGTVIWWYAAAGLLALLNIFGAGREIPFRRFLSLAVVGSIYLFFRDGFVFLILKLKGTESIRSLEDLQAPIGLDLLLGEPGTFWWRLAGFVNMFELATVAFLAYGFHRITGASAGYSTVGVGLLWLLWTVTRALMGTYFGPGF